MIIDEDSFLAHFGILRKSGRYPWGSGGTQSARNKTFLDIVEGHRRAGMTDVQIAEAYSTPDHKMTTTQLRALKSIAKTQQRQADIAMAQRLHEKGLSNVAIGRKMELNESSVRALLAPGQKDKADVLAATTGMLKDQVAQKKYVDVGIGVERYLGVSKDKLGVAIASLKEEGYTLHYVKMPQLGTGKDTTHKVLAAPDVKYTEVYKNRYNIQLPIVHSEDGGRNYTPNFQHPLSINSKRVQVRYADEGGSDADGVIYVRPGVADVSLGGKRYAQVRVSVDGTHYLKGMAMYKDDLPAGVDLIYNVNKHPTGDKHDAMKPMLRDRETDEVDMDNPFGSSISRQVTHPSTHKVTSVMNIVNEEGTWETWSRTLSSQFLSKQSPKLAKTQLDMVTEKKQMELEDILKLTNPAVRRKLLTEFADAADASSVHLEAAHLPRQANRVILPISSLKENEIYAPGFRNGERVVLVRHPHGGIFEIPELTVNNRNAEGKRLLGPEIEDSVGISAKVAQRLSGADFDGDTVLVIPNNDGRVKHKPALAGLKGFDPVSAYPGYPGMPKMKTSEKQFQMGDISNLITDMTIRGANDGELAQAVRHSMVVIDAEKHHLNWKQSSIDNGVAALKTKYQGKSNAGAKTLISRAESRLDVPQRKQGYRIDPQTGVKVFTPTGASYVDARGKTVVNTDKSKKLAETEDAHTLSSGRPIEKIYADHSNKLKALANKARLEVLATKSQPRSSSARIVYAPEVAALNAKLNIALKNAPIERHAQVLANGVVSQKMKANPDMDKSQIKKLKSRTLTEMRNRTGASKTRVEITDREWEAIQAGAISNSMLSKILDNADPKVVRAHATPKSELKMTSIKIRRAKAMVNSGFTQAEIADALGVSLTTLKVGLSEEG